MAEEDVDEVARAVYLSVGLFLRRFRQAPTDGGLPMPERSALSRLDRRGPSTAADLARVEQISPQAMATTLRSLEQRGLIEHRTDPSDGRRIMLSVTAAGGELLRHKRDARARQLAKALADEFTPGELATLLAAAPLIERLAERV